MQDRRRDPARIAEHVLKHCGVDRAVTLSGIDERDLARALFELIGRRVTEIQKDPR
jgi:hypothetical protein